MQQQKALFERAAAALLPQWNIGDHAIKWISYSSNAVFHVETATKQLILRLHAPGRVAEGKLRAELTWLRAIRERTTLLAPYPVHFANGRFYAVFSPSILSSTDKIYCVLFERLAGESKSAAALSLTDLRQTGEYLGKLHRDGQFNPPRDFDRHRLDFDGLFGAGSPYHVASENEVLTQEQRNVFQAVKERVRQAMACLDRRGDRFGLIHADLLAKNMVFDNGSVGALDFEYCGWGYFLYDLAPLLWQLKGDRNADYSQLQEGFWAAYVSVRKAAADERRHLETLIAARQLLSCRWLLQNMHKPEIRELAPALLKERTVELQGYLSTGVLQRQSATL